MGIIGRAVLIVVFLTPVVFMVLGSLRGLGIPPAKGFELVPAGAGLDAYRALGEHIPVWRMLGNSTLVVLVAVPLTVLVASWAGFALAQLPRRPRRLLLGVTLAMLLIPLPLVWVPRFFLYSKLGVLDTLLPVMAPAIAATTPFTVLLTYRAFRRVSPELFEAARAEGASALTTWWRVGMPLVRPTTTAVAAIAFALHWGNYLDALLYVRTSATRTLPLGLSQLAGLDTNDAPVLLAGAVVLTLPPLLLLAGVQRTLLRGALAMTLVLGTACGGGAADQQTTGRIVVQAAGGESEIKALEEMADAFERTHEGVTVEVVGVAEQGDHMARLATAFAGGEPPDVFLLNYRRFGQFAAKGVIEPAELATEDYFRQPLDVFTFEGRLLCRPQNISSTVTYFNPALFQRAGAALPKPGWTWADMRAAAEKLASSKIEAIGFEHTMRTVAPFVWAAGGEVVDNTAAPTRISLDTAPAGAALDYLNGLLPLGVDAADAAADPAEERFARGELGMFLDSRRAVPKLRKSDGLVFDVAPLPTGSAGAATLLASDGYCVSKAGKRKAVAHAFAEYAVGPEGGKVLAAAGRTVPSHKALASSPEFLSPDKPPASSPRLARRDPYGSGAAERGPVERGRGERQRRARAVLRREAVAGRGRPPYRFGVRRHPRPFVTAALELEGVGFRYPDGDGWALRDVDLSVEPGEILAVVGPSGSGKSTLLRLVCGLAEPQEGVIRIEGSPVAGVPPERRPVAMVFQGFALFPHLSVAENIAFGLRVRREADVDVRVKEAAGLLAIDGLLDRAPGQLSGGERQRVALARALVRDPRVFCLDEPLSSLDPVLRAESRRLLTGLLPQGGRAAVYVTHDQAEAMTVGHRVAVLRDGRLEQVAAPREVYDRPATPFVASFLGTPPAALIDVPGGGTLAVRPEHVVLTEGDDAVVIGVEDLGHEVHVELDLGLTARVGAGHAVAVGERVGVFVRPEDVLRFWP